MVRISFKFNAEKVKAAGRTEEELLEPFREKLKPYGVQEVSPGVFQKEGKIKSKRKGYKYDAAYIRYVENGESKAVYITRDIVESINTEDKWIDVLDIDNVWLNESDWRIKSFTVELFPRKTHPKYPKGACLEEKNILPGKRLIWI